MGPMRVEVQDENGDWIFASYAYNAQDLAGLMHVIFQDSKIRVHEGGQLMIEKNGSEIKDYRIN